MKSIITYLFALVLLFNFSSLSAQEFEMDENESENTEKPDSSKVTAGAVIGATTIAGENFQQLSFRTDIPIGKLGIGLDVQLNIDEDGKIRKEDWDEWHDWLDKFYYIRWAHKGAPFYFKVGGLDYSYLGYSNVVNGYTNMVEYPTVKRWGLETSFFFGPKEDGRRKKKMGAEFFINDFKEAFREQPSMLFGTRLSYRPIGRLEIGATYATDLNEYNGLQDDDDDGIPDEIDYFPHDGDWATERDKVEAKLTSQGLGLGAVDDMIAIDELDSLKKEDLFNLNEEKSQSQVWSFDIGYPIIERAKIKLDIYSHYTNIVNHGWGVTAPGLRFIIGERGFLTFKAEYRRSSDEFIFGYYDHTYEIERANFERNKATNELEVITKQDKLKSIDKELNGFFVGLDINLAGYVIVGAHYQDLHGVDKDINRRSIRGEITLGEKLQAQIPVNAKGYYYQNNVENFKEWKTPSTILGYMVGYNMNGVEVGFDYRYTFQDLDGNGLIRGDEETNKTIGLRTSMRF